MSHEVWRHLAKHPTGRRRWRDVGWGRVRWGRLASRGWKKARIAPRGRLNHESVESHQLSGFSCVSMSTRQIGHFLLVASHWSTQPWWKRCMQGSLLTSSPSSSMDKHMVHFSSTSVSSSSPIFNCRGFLFLYLCGKVNLSMVV